MAGLTKGVFLALAVVSYVVAKPVDDGAEHVELRMPTVQPKVADTYLCHPMKLNPEKPDYLTGFAPHANMSIAHHILLYGCTEPGESNQDGAWNCGEMMSTSGEKSEYKLGPVCKDGAQIIYAWAMDAPKLDLPKDVAFKVGGDTSVQWLVLQVHYKDVSPFLPPANGHDSSGLTLTRTSTPLPKRAGVYLLGTGGEIPAHSTTYMETACEYTDPFVIHPFAFRVHAHTHGEVVAGYRVRDNDWEEIGRQSPKKPQMFYNITHPGMVVRPGDTLAARCTMVNDDDKDVAIGSTQNDEMCNFYVMYYVDGDQTMHENYCFSAGPPNWDWNSFGTFDMDKIPFNASVIPGTETLLKASRKFFENAEKTFAEANENIQENFMHLLQELRGEDEPALDNMFQKYGYDEMENLLNEPRYANMMVDEIPMGYGNQRQEWGNNGYGGWEEEEEEPYMDSRFNIRP